MMATTEHIDHYLIGLGNTPSPRWSEEVLDLIQRHTLFSGGHRHHALVKTYLPQAHQWIPIQGKMTEVIEEYQKSTSPIVIFVSGDPFFFGFGNTLRRYLPQAKLKAFPHFNCLQLLSHRLYLNYSEMKCVSVHGRPWEALDTALMAGEPLIGVLTDSSKNPAAIAQRMMDYGFHHYQMLLGEELEGSQERITHLSLEEAANHQSAQLNCLILKGVQRKYPALGLPDAAFQTLLGRPKMITKSAIRLTTIGALQLDQAGVFWDVGSCTGSVAIEAKRQFPGLAIMAFEKRMACESILTENMRKFNAPGIQVVMGDIMDQDLSNWPAPDVIFIGGHGNRLSEMITHMNRYLKPGGRLVMNTVKPESKMTFITACQQWGYQCQDPTMIQVNAFNPIEVLVAIKSIS